MPVRKISPSARAPVASGIVRLKKTMPRRPMRSWFQSWASPIATTVVRRPPAVPPGDPPMIISTISTCAVKPTDLGHGHRVESRGPRGDGVEKRGEHAAAVFRSVS